MMLLLLLLFLLLLCVCLSVLNAVLRCHYPFMRLGLEVQCVQFSGI